jgi:hypothetical protein
VGRDVAAALRDQRQGACGRGATGTRPLAERLRLEGRCRQLEQLSASGWREEDVHSWNGSPIHAVRGPRVEKEGDPPRGVEGVLMRSIIRVAPLALLIVLTGAQTALAKSGNRSLKVTSLPTGAQVLIDGVYACKSTPMSTSARALHAKGG